MKILFVTGLYYDLLPLSHIIQERLEYAQVFSKMGGTFCIQNKRMHYKFNVTLRNIDS